MQSINSSEFGDPVEWLALSPQKVLVLILPAGWALSAWSLHLLTPCAGVSFFPQSKDIKLM